MAKLYIFAVVFLFWTTLAASLMQVQLVASPVHKLRVPMYRSQPIHAASFAQVPVAAATSCN